MNNKGQSLVTFVLIVPILLLIFLLVVDVGQMVVIKQKLNDVNYIAMDYGLDNIEDANLITKMEDVILKNDDKVIIEKIELINNKIYLKTSKKMDGIFLGSIGIKVFDVKSSYVGYIDESKKKIERDT